MGSIHAFLFNIHFENQNAKSNSLLASLHPIPFFALTGCYVRNWYTKGRAILKRDTLCLDYVV